MEQITTTKYEIIPFSSSAAVTTPFALRRGGNPFRLALRALRDSNYVSTTRINGEFSIHHAHGFLMTLRHDDTLTISDFRGDGNLPRAYADFVLRESGLRLEEHTDEFQIKAVSLYGGRDVA
jgi:hypothetical protein